jgi:hypothetical protein
VRQAAASRATEHRSRNRSTFTFVIDARVLFVVVDGTRRLVKARPVVSIDCAQGHGPAASGTTIATRWRDMRNVSWRARLREGALSLLALSTLLSILYFADIRVREGATHIVSTTSNTGVARYGSQFTADTSKLVRNVREGGVQHGVMTAFVGTAAVLLLFMLKT